MAEESFEEKTESPSEKRRLEARQKGNVAKSTELNSSLVLLAALLMLRISGKWMIDQIASVFHRLLEMMQNPIIDDSKLAALTMDMIVFMIKVCLPILGGILLIGILSNVLQVGVLFTAYPLIPRLDKIDPIAGMKRLFSMRSVVELIKGMVKLAIIASIAYLTIKGEFEQIIMLGNASAFAIAACLAGITLKILFRIVIALLFLSILDFAYQRYENEKKLKMTRQELKEERKQLEGDPLIKSRIRSIQREMARRRMMQEVPKATVVVTNPTFIAIALRYEVQQMDAPVVVAKGKRLIAEQIRRLALENGVPIYEDKPLARAMYDKVEVGSKIPTEFFTAVAEVLAYVYRLKGKVAA